MTLNVEGDERKNTQSILTATQISLHIFRSKKEYGAPNSKHNHIYNSPSLWYICLLLHDKYPCKEMLNDLKNLGLYRHYKVLLEFLTSSGNTQILHYCGQNAVCSSKVKKVYLQQLLLTILINLHHL